MFLLKNPLRPRVPCSAPGLRLACKPFPSWVPLTLAYPPCRDPAGEEGGFGPVPSSPPQTLRHSAQHVYLGGSGA